MPGRAPRRGLVYALVFMASTAATLAAQTGDPPRIFISVDMEGISGVGTPAMTSSGGKDYATGRRLATDEVNAVVAAILARGPAEIVVNDSHGDHQNLLHTDLDPRVTYIQGSVKAARYGRRARFVLRCRDLNLAITRARGPPAASSRTPGPLRSRAFG